MNILKIILSIFLVCIVVKLKSQDTVLQKHSVVLDAFGPCTYLSLSFEKTFTKKSVCFETGFGLGYSGSFSSKLGPNFLYLMPYVNFRLNKKISPFISLCYTPSFDPYAVQNKENYVCPSLNNCPEKMFWANISERIGISFNFNKIVLRPYYCGLIDIKYKTHYSWFGLSLGYYL